MTYQIKYAKGKSVGSLTQKLQTVFNEFIRERDKDLPCISCGRFTGSQAGHFFNVGFHSWLRFCEENCHLQCTQCNFFKHGNELNYRIGLVKRYGEDYVKRLELKAQIRTVMKWSRFELEVMIEYYRQKIKKL